MFNSQGIEVLIQRLDQLPNSGKGARRLVVLFGLLGDFDSIEYAQILSRALPILEASEIKLHAIGIGNNDSLNRFCIYTGIPKGLIQVERDSSIHDSLGLSRGLRTPFGSWVDLLLMCAGVGSKGTLREVFRGYIGDRKSTQIISNTQKIKLGSIFDIDGSFFAKIFGQGYLRPLELATVRLCNLLEVLDNLSTYMVYHEFLTQRGATFLLDKDDRLLYAYRPSALLGFSKQMSHPLKFLENWLSK